MVMTSRLLLDHTALVAHCCGQKRACMRALQRAFGSGSSAATRALARASRARQPAKFCAGAGAARCLSAGAGDPWSVGARKRTSGPPGGGALLLVEKTASISDVSLGEPSQLPCGGLEDWTTPVSSESSLRLTLFDKAAFDLEAPFLESTDGEHAASVGLEDAFLSPALAGVMHGNKPHVENGMGQDVTETRIFLHGGGHHRPDAPFVKILELTKNISGENVLKVRRTNESDDAVGILRDPANILTGNVVTSELHLDSLVESVKQSIAWIWPHGHAQFDEIKLEWLDGSPISDAEVSGKLLLRGKVNDPTTPFSFSRSTFVPAEYRISINDIHVHVLVNKNDVKPLSVPRPSGRKQSAGFSTILPSVAFAVGAGVVMYLMYNRPELPAPPTIPTPKAVQAPPPPPTPPILRTAPPPPAREIKSDDMGLIYDIFILTCAWYHLFYIYGMV